MEESVAEGGVAEGFGATGAEGGEGSGEVGEGGGAEGVLAVEPGVEEAGVEAVAGTDGVGGGDEERGDPVALDALRGALLDEGSAGAALDDDEGDAGGKGGEGFVEGGLVSDLLEFFFVGEEEVDLVEEGGEDARPVAEGIVIGIEREGEAGLLERIKEAREAGVEGGLEEEGGEMEVAGGGKVGEVEVGDGHFGHDAGVGEDVSLGTVGEEEGDAGAGGGNAGNVRCVEAGLGEARDGDVTHLVGTDVGGEADAGAKEGEIVGEDRGRAAEGEIEGGAKEFALGGEGRGKAIENEVEVGLAGDGNIERFGGRARMWRIHTETSCCLIAHGAV